MTGEDGSYDVKYNRVENLLGELTRIMDNMESSMIPQQPQQVDKFFLINRMRIYLIKIQV